MNHKNKTLQKLALQYKKENKMRDNNCKENHDRGLEKRKGIFGIQETVRSMQNEKRFNDLQKFYGKTLKMLKLA